MTLLNASEEAETRILAKVGATLVLVVVAAAACYLIAKPLLANRSRDNVIAVVIQAPYAGQGVAAGTPLIMHGVKVGEVRSVSNISGGGVRLSTDLQSGPTRGLTDTMQIEYRPSNYFGVTGINITPGGSGQPLRSGMQLDLTPKGNYSLQALLYRLGELSNGVFDQRMISVIDRVTRYVDGLDPLLETVLMVGTSVAKVQTVSTEQLLRNSTGISVAFPSVIDAAGSTGDLVLNTYPGLGLNAQTADKIRDSQKYYPAVSDREREWYNHNVQLFIDDRDKFNDTHFIPIMDTARTDLFGKIGKLEGSHVDDLFPVVESVRALTDTVPKVLSAEGFESTVTDLHSRFERMYASSGDLHALPVRLILDRLPGVEAPLGVLMGAP